MFPLMEPVFAIQITVVVTFLFLGYNLFQLSAGYAWMQGQIGQFKDQVKTHGVALPYLRRLNAGIIASTGVAYFSILYAAGFVWWILCIMVCKLFITGLLSDFFQARVVKGKEFLPLHFWIGKVDVLLNIVGTGFLILLCFFS